MKTHFNFRQVERSEEMIEYVIHRLEKLRKFEWQPMSAHITFCAERHACRTEIRVSGRGMTMKAVVEADSYADGVDQAVAKLQRQLEKKKNRVQDHLVPSNTRSAKLERASALEDPETPLRRRRSA